MTPLLVTLAGVAAATEPVPWKVNLSEDQWVRILVWNQLWVRATELDPGTTVQGEEAEFATDVALRRARVLFFSQITPKIHALTHFGVNNQSFSSTRRPQLYVHDATVDFELAERELYLGAGLHYWAGPSRMTNASTLTFLALDSPIFPWSTIDQTDQFARRLGLYAKGKITKIDYRVALDRPFAPETPLVPDGPVGFRQDANTWSTGGYVMAQLADEEPNAMPFLNGTWLGAKKVFNLGGGWTWHPGAMGRANTAGETVDTFDAFTLAADVFADLPVGSGAVTAYGLYEHIDFGPDYVRNVGILNLGAGGETLSGWGNAAPVIGTGEHLYAQAGWLLPGTAGHPRVQPFLAAHVAALEAFDHPTSIFEAGANLYLAGQNAKLTADVKLRPIVELEAGQTVTSSYSPDAVLQLATSF